jgi:hypothetical protein
MRTEMPSPRLGAEFGRSQGGGRPCRWYRGVARHLLDLVGGLSIRSLTGNLPGTLGPTSRGAGGHEGAFDHGPRAAIRALRESARVASGAGGPYRRTPSVPPDHGGSGSGGTETSGGRRGRLRRTRPRAINPTTAAPVAPIATPYSQSQAGGPAAGETGLGWTVIDVEAEARTDPRLLKVTLMVYVPI